MKYVDARYLLRWRLRTWVVTAAVALLAGGLAAVAMSRAQQMADSLGPMHSVWVAVGALEPGHQLGDADVEARELPAGLVASEVPDDPVGRVVTSPIFAGEPLVEERLAGEGETGLLAGAPQGTRAVALSLGPAHPPLSAGDQVDVLAPARGEGGGTHYGRWVARGATVLDVADDSVVVAVEPDEAASTAGAALEGPLAVVLVSSR